MIPTKIVNYNVVITNFNKKVTVSLLTIWKSDSMGVNFANNKPSTEVGTLKDVIPRRPNAKSSAKLRAMKILSKRSKFEFRSWGGADGILSKGFNQYFKPFNINSETPIRSKNCFQLKPCLLEALLRRLYSKSQK